MKIAFLFPGQGTQYIGMGKDIAEKYEAARTVYKSVYGLSGIDAAKISFFGPAEELKIGKNTQLAILAMSIGIFNIIIAGGIKPDIIAGHSLGEYSALIAGGGVDIEHGLNLVKHRGEIMSKAAVKFPGTMAAINGLSCEAVENLCRMFDSVCVANYNSPSQFVISGPRQGVDGAAESAKKSGGKITYLSVNGAFHSPLMKEASQEFLEALNTINIKEPVYPLIGNVHASILSKNTDIRDELTKHMISPVRWCEIIEKMLDIGVQKFVEVGPGDVLKGLVLRTYRKAQVYTTGTVRELEIAIERLKSL